MRIHIKWGDLIKIVEHLGLTNVIGKPQYLEQRVKETGDTYVLVSKFNRIVFAPNIDQTTVK